MNQYKELGAYIYIMNAYFNRPNSHTVKDMKTDEYGANQSDIQIRIEPCGAIHEILGNMSSKWQAIDIDITKNRIITFNKSNWTNEDKVAIFKKRKSGSDRETASINGHGIKLVLDRLLTTKPEGEHSWKKTWSTYYVTRMSTDDKLVGQKCRIGNFQYTEWEHMDSNDIGRYKALKSDIGIPNTVLQGTLCHIPINDTWKKKLKGKKRKREMLEYLRRQSNLYLNKMNFQEGGFYFNKERQSLIKICKDNAIDIKLSYYWDTTNTLTERTTSPFWEIDNYNEVITYFPKLKKRFYAHSAQANMWKKEHLLKEYERITENPQLKEKVTLRFSIITKQNSVEQGRNISPGGESDLEGVMLYYKNRCLTESALKSKMGGKIGGGEGAIGDKYKGKVRHEIIITEKRSMFVYLPANKSNVKLQGDGEKLTKFLRLISELHDHHVKNKNQYLPPIAPPIPIPPPPPPPIPRPNPTDNQRKLLWIQQFGNVFEAKCNCGQTMTPCWGGNPKSHLCHIKSHNNGGKIENENLYWACHRCNGNTTADFLSEISDRYGYNSNTYNLFKNDFERLNKIFVEPEN